MIYHPDSPFKGQIVHNPVELVDLYPTIIDLLVVPYNYKAVYEAPRMKYLRRFQPLEGRSLAPMVLGKNYFGKNKSLIHPPPSKLRHQGSLTTAETNKLIESCVDINKCGYLSKSFAISQMWKCAKKDRIHLDARSKPLNPGMRMWADCDMNNLEIKSELSLMGYSMRTIDFRYTAWIPFNRKTLTPEWQKMLYAEELYDHRREQLGDDYIHEMVNVAPRMEYRKILKYYRERLIKFIQEKLIYRQRDHPNRSKNVLESMEAALLPPKSSTEAKSSAVSSNSGGSQRNLRKLLLTIWSNIEHDIDGTNKLVDPRIYQ
jgi:hypothetical protein